MSIREAHSNHLRCTKDSSLLPWPLECIFQQVAKFSQAKNSLRLVEMAKNAPAGPVKLGAIFVTMFAFPKRAILSPYFREQRGSQIVPACSVLRQDDRD
jgi:hypothetical protein